MNSAQIRQQFIDFFGEKEHTFVPSSPVVPYDDPTLLFTNAGMNQFKDVFLGSGRRAYTRAANSQKCIRAGGKHNDLDDVGHDTYHHTFFEMLGNWSFGDYFKAEAIAWAWELLVQRWGLQPQRLHATYFEGDTSEGLEPDTEARDLWYKILPADHVHPGSKKDNFWEMGDTGPCGPCSEIHMDLTPDNSGAPLVNAGNPQVIEIWNLVFIQFNRDPAGKLTPLPARHVDTGMGFERVSALLQGKNSNYDTDIFSPIFEAVRRVTGAAPYTGLLEGQSSGPDVMKDVSYRVIADHIRCLTFALTDGAVLSNEGRGYVLRRILRRAVRYGRQFLNTPEPFLHKLVPDVVGAMGAAFPELNSNPDAVATVILEEEESFSRTYERGVRLFEEAADYARRHHHGRISGEDAFKLHDTYGFPIDLTELMAEERGMRVDLGEYERLMEQAREKARRGASDQDALDQFAAWFAIHPEARRATDDTAKYEGTALQHATIVRLLRPVAEDEWAADLCEALEELSNQDLVGVILDRTCFYAEQGGQVGDRGRLFSDGAQFAVETTLRIADSVIHVGRLERGSLSPGQDVHLRVDAQRMAIMSNHTATHILNWALRDVLGGHVQQKGSLVDERKTRFDFSHPHPLTAEQIRQIEDKANTVIEADLPVYKEFVSLAEAHGIRTLRAVFGEKYPDPVRVVSVGAPIGALLADPEDPKWMNYAVELCGGTHLSHSGEAECFHIIEETAVAKGVRRITAVTGERATACENNAASLHAAGQRLGGLADDALAEHLPEFARRVNEEDIPYLARRALRESLAQIQDRMKQHARRQAQSDAHQVREAALQLLKLAPESGGSRIIVGQVPPAQPEQIREVLDLLRSKAGSAAILLGMLVGEKVMLFAAMTDDLVGKGLKSGDLIKAVAPIVGGGGGGKPQLAQAGGKHPHALPQALRQARQWIATRL